MTHSWVTIAIPMESARAAATRAELRKMDNPAKREVREALRQDLKVHFMSTGVIDGDPGQPSHLVIEISSDLAPGPRLPWSPARWPPGTDRPSPPRGSRATSTPRCGPTT